MSGQMKRRVFFMAWILALAVAATIPALAIVRGTVWVGPTPYRSHGPLTHPLLAIGTSVSLRHGSQAMVIVLFGSVHLGGPVRDDVAAIEAPIYLHSGADVRRDIVSVGQTVFRAPNVHISGRVGGDMVPWRGTTSGRTPSLAALTWHYSSISFAAGLALLLLCTCIGMAFPWQTVLVANSLYREPSRSVVAGLMGLFLFAFLAVPLGLSLLGLPFAILLSVAGAAAWLLGLTSCAVTIGRHLARLRGHDAGLLWAVVSGMFALALAGAIPWIGILIVGIAGVTGAGSLALTMITRARPDMDMTSRPEFANETLTDADPYIEPGDPLAHGRSQNNYWE